MDFWDLTKLMVRRWYISVTLLLATIGATAYTAVAVQPDYALTAYVQLIPPTVASDPNKVISVQNPWLALGISSLSNAATVSTQDQTFLDSLAAKDGSASFEITIGDQNPVAIIAVVAPTLQQAESATKTITDHYEQTVESLQTQYGVKPADMITAYRLDKGENIKRPGGKVKRAVVVVFAIGILATGGVTILFDVLARRRRRPKGQEPKGQENVPAKPDPPVVSAPTPGNVTIPIIPRQSTSDDAKSNDWEKTRAVEQSARDRARGTAYPKSPPGTVPPKRTGRVVISSTARPADSPVPTQRANGAGDPEANHHNGG